jgi:hypothetical protein
MLPLIEAIKRLDVSAVKKALVEGADPNTIARGTVIRTTTHGRFRSDPYAIEVLFEQELYFRGQKRIRPEVEPIFLAFIEHGVDLTISVLDKPLIAQAAREGLDACVLALLERGADVNAMEDRVRSTAMHYAVGHCQLETIKLMVAYGADVNALDIEDLPPLNSLFANERPEVVEFLRSQGAKKLQWVSPGVYKLE